MIDTDTVPPEIAEELARVEQEASAAIGDVATVYTDSTAAPILPIKRKRGRPRKEPALSWKPCIRCKDPTVEGDLCANCREPAPSAFITPLADFRERVAICREALVETYEDGPLKLRFDVEARRALVRPMGDAPKW